MVISQRQKQLAGPLDFFDFTENVLKHALALYTQT